MSTGRHLLFVPTWQGVSASFPHPTIIFILKMPIFAFAIAKWDSKSPCSTPLMNTNAVQARAFCRNLRSKMFSIAIERACLKNGASIFALAHCPIESGFDS